MAEVNYWTKGERGRKKTYVGYTRDALQLPYHLARAAREQVSRTVTHPAKKKLGFLRIQIAAVRRARKRCVDNWRPIIGSVRYMSTPSPTQL